MARIRLPPDVLAAIPAWVNAPLACRCPEPRPIPVDDLRFCWGCKVWHCKNCAAAHDRACLHKEE